MNIHVKNKLKKRRGSVMALMGFMLPVLAILAAFCVNTAHMQLTRTELTVATDASAKAAGRAFSEVQTVQAAKDAGRVTAALNFVNGQPLMVRESDGANEIEFGKTVQPNGTTGRYEFVKIPTSTIESGQEVASAVRVTGLRNSLGLSGKVPLIIPGLLAQNDFSTVQSSVAMQVDRDISLIIDRSSSMTYFDFDWPNGTSPWSTSALNAGVAAGLLYQSWGGYNYSSGVNSTSYQQWAWTNHFNLGPAPRPPWDDLVEAVHAFLDVLDLTSQEEQVSLASYASTATLDTYLEKNHQIIRNKIDSMSPYGNTAIGLGMQTGFAALLDAAARPYAAKTMVVMTDGVHNQGSPYPNSVATSYMGSYNLTIHTVTFGDGADQPAMQTVAATGGGKHYHAATGADLITIFEEIANNLPTILTN